MIDFFPLSECVLEGTMMIDPSVFQNLPRPSEWVLNAGRKSKRKTRPFKTLAKGTAKRATTGLNNVPGITLYADGTWERGGIKS